MEESSTSLLAKARASKNMPAKSSVLVLIFLLFLFNGCINLAYETIKNATPVEVTVKANAEKTVQVSKKILTEYGYQIDQKSEILLIAKAPEEDRFIELSAFFDQAKNKTDVTMWRFRKERNPLSYPGDLSKELLPATWQMRQIAVTIKKQAEAVS